MSSYEKAKVVHALRDIALFLQLKGENAYRCRAYEIAADRIAGITEDLAVLASENRLQDLPGIGAALAEKINELVSTGRMQFLESLRAEFPAGILDLLKIPELGPRKAAMLWRQLEIGDLASLENACRAGKVAELKRFGEKTQEKLLSAIDFFRRSRGRRRLGDVLPVANDLLDRVKAVQGVQRASLGGSVRRFCETVGDIDIIASATEPQTVLQAYATFPQVSQILGQGDSKCSVRLLPDDLQADLRVLPDEDYATALHHFTGSKAHHIRLRGLAQDRGLKISEWGIHRGEQKLPIESEAQIYQLLDMQYVPPELREDCGEVEVAQDRALPQDLLQREDLLGIVHSHSTWSDGRNSLEAMAVRAQHLGLGYLTVTEHSQSAGYAGGLTFDDLKRQWDEIDQINEKISGFRLLKGIEVDILESGELDFPETVLEKLDVVIGSIHVRFQMDEEQMTKRVLRAFDNPHLHIFGHPTGRLIQSREPYPLRMEAVAEKAALQGIALEVNGNPKRLDLKSEHVRIALEHGTKLVASADAHSLEDLDNLRFAAGTARKGWARKGDVLNTLPATEFVAKLKSLRQSAR